MEDKPILTEEEKLARRLQSYYAEDGRLKQYPSKRVLRPYVLAKLAACFAFDRDYTEKEVNAILDAQLTFGDVMLMRRELVDEKYLARTRDCARYWRLKNEEEGEETAVPSRA